MNEYNILKDIGDTSSINAKIAILREHSSNAGLKKVFDYAYNPTRNFYLTSKQLDYVPATVPILVLEDGYKILDQLAARKLSGNEAISEVSRYLEYVSYEDAVVFCRILDRDLRVNCTDSLCNRAWGSGDEEFIGTYPVLLCEKDTPKSRAKITFPAIVQTKMDGLRINAHVNLTNETVEYRSRNGKVVNCGSGKLDYELTELAVELGFGDVVFDGELLTLDEKGNPYDRKTSNGWANKATKGVVPDDIRNRFAIFVWDYIPSGDFKARKSVIPYEEKFGILSRLIKKQKLVKLVSTKLVDTMQEAERFYSEQRKAGQEGAVLKNRCLVWEDRRSKDSVKMKAFDTMDMRVTGWNEGKGKYVGMLGSLNIETDNGRIKAEVGIGKDGSMDDAARTKMTEKFCIGRIVEIGYNEIVSDKRTGQLSLFLPQFICFRDDKDTTDE